MTSQERMNELMLQGILDRIPLADLLRTISKEIKIEIYICGLFGKVILGNDTTKFSDFLQNNSFSYLRSDQPLWIRKGQIDGKCYYMRRISGREKRSEILVMEYTDGDTDQEQGFLEYTGDSLIRLFVYMAQNSVTTIDADKSFTSLLSRELLLNNDETAERLIAQTTSIRLILKPPYRIVSFCAKKGNGDLPSICRQLVHRLPSPYVQVSENMIFVFLYGIPSTSGNRIAEENYLEQCCRTYELAGCISSEFTELGYRQHHLAQVKTLLPICMQLNPEAVLYYAHDYFSEHMILQAYTHLEPGAMHLTAIDYLEKTDRENGTEYLKTLECYLNNQLNAAAAARELFIDRTTLKYRLKRINETIYVNIEEPLTAFALKLGLIFRRVEQAYLAGNASQSNS